VLRWRLLLGTLLVGGLIALVWLDAMSVVPGLWLLPLVAAISLLASHELLELLAVVGMMPVRWLVQVANLAVIAGTWIVGSEGFEGRGSFTFIPLVPTQRIWLLALPVLIACTFLIAIFVSEMWRYGRTCSDSSDNGILASATGNVAGGILALAYVGMMLQCAVALRLWWGIGAVVSWIVIVKMSDIGAYTVGRLIGRHKMVPRLSPGKTIEGAIGGLLFSCLGAWAVFNWLGPICDPHRFPPMHGWSWLIFGTLLGAAGMFGDLAESLLKRDAGRKDSSTWFPGFGGVLDVVDSLLLSAPVALLCWAAVS
jgi:phosphatidate cytidylyltransferase